MAPEASGGLWRLAYPRECGRHRPAGPLLPGPDARPRLRPELSVRRPPHRAPGAHRAVAVPVAFAAVPLCRGARPRPRRGVAGSGHGRRADRRGGAPTRTRHRPHRPRQRRLSRRWGHMVAAGDQSAPRRHPRRARSPPDAAPNSAYRGGARPDAVNRGCPGGCDGRRDLLRGPDLCGGAAARLAGSRAGSAASRQPCGARRTVLHGDGLRAGRRGGQARIAGEGRDGPRAAGGDGEQS